MEQKPLIHLLRSPGGYYFYETNRNEIVSTSKEAYELLEKMMDPEENAAEWLRHPVLATIQEKGYLSYNRPTKIEHPMAKYLKEILSRKMEKITLQLTQDCNLRCDYCAYTSGREDRQRTHGSATMSEETMRKSIDFFQQHSYDIEDVNVSFYDGEPFLVFSLLQKAVLYAKETLLGKNLTFNMTSNGTMLTNEMIAFCMEHDIQLMISLDGPQEIHDIHRKFIGSNKGSFDVIMNNLKRVEQYFPEYMRKISFNMVIDPSNGIDCANHMFIDYTLINKRMTQATLVDSILLDQNYEINDEFRTKSIYDLFLVFLYEAKRISDHHISPLSLGTIDRSKTYIRKKSQINRLLETMAPSGPCVPGAKRAMVDVHGNLFPCERCSEISPVMQIGNLDDGFDLEQATALLNIGQLAEAECRNCWAITGCTCCASRIDDGECLSTAMKMNLCQDIKGQVDQDIRNTIMLYELRQHESLQTHGTNLMEVLINDAI